jgi:predicted alpha/beta-hydrolase family hydrolase
MAGKKPERGGPLYQHLGATGELNAGGSSWGGGRKSSHVVAKGVVKGAAFVLRGGKGKGGKR